MEFSIGERAGYLRVDVYRRETAEETKRYLNALAAESERTGCRKVMIWIHASRPIFRVAQYDLADFFRQARAMPGTRVALLGDSHEVRASQEYVQVLARQEGVAARAFIDESAAAAWLTGEEAER
ncbi:MAG TPA: hypothetical protein VFB08_19945 [Burkholderiales bacterium]|nr:hypothetical protein [Burkholderiales bacterium]